METITELSNNPDTKCEFCSLQFDSKAGLLTHYEKTPICSRKSIAKILKETGIPKKTARIDLTGFLKMFK